MNNFNINAKYLEAVQKFQFIEASEDSFTLKGIRELNQLVRDISVKIISASSSRNSLANMAKHSISLREACYWETQKRDQQSETDTATCIDLATLEEKLVLNHVVKKLSKDFVQVEPQDLEIAALLFGIQSIHHLVSTKLITISRGQNPEIQEIENELATLIALRNKYEGLPIFNIFTIRLLKELDTKIQMKIELLEKQSKTS